MTAQEAAALRAMLNQRNVALIRDWAELEASLSKPQVPFFLEPYRTKIVGYCHGYLMETQANLALLQLQNDTILEDLLSRTQVATTLLRVISTRLATPVLRASPGDTLCLKILTWIHQSHPETAAFPAAFANGDVAVWPTMRGTPVYFFPGLEQSGLLFQSLHYHEFGHVLYVLHRPELDDLIKELQESISAMLTPLSQRNDPHAAVAAKKRESVVGRWYDWAQEVFCDAVALTIGGPAYLYAFSMYCNNLSKSDLYLTGEDLERSKHPVTWLRVRLLVKRAKELGLAEAAARVEQEWNVLAAVMQITEDYHGYYEDVIEEEVHRIVGDMLAEAGARQFLPEEIEPGAETYPDDSSVTLLNRAWRVYHSSSNSYAAWEKNAIGAYLA